MEATPSLLEVTVDTAPGRATITFIGRLNMEAAHIARQSLRAAHHTSTHLAVDLSGVERIDAAGLGVLFATLRRAESAGGSLCVTHASAAVRAAIRTVGLTDMLKSAPVT